MFTARSYRLSGFPPVRRVVPPTLAALAMTLVGMAGGVIMDAAAPRAAWAQAQNNAADDFSDVTKNPANDTFQPASVLMTNHSGKLYLFTRTPQVVQPTGLRALYEVSTQSSDKKWTNPKPFGLTLPQLPKEALGISGDAFTMPYAVVEIDAGNLFVVYAQPDNYKSATESQINVSSVDELMKGRDTFEMLNVTPASTPQNPVYFPADNTSHGLGAVALPSPGAKTGDPNMGMLVAYSTGRATIRLAAFRYKDNAFGRNPMGTQEFRLDDPLYDFKPNAHGWGGDVAVQVIANPNYDPESKNPNLIVAKTSPSDPSMNVRDLDHPFIAYVALARNDALQIGRVLLKHYAASGFIKPEAKMEWVELKTGSGVNDLFESPKTPGFVTLNKGLFGEVSIGYLDIKGRAREIGLVETANIPYPSGDDAYKVAVDLTSTFYAVDRGFPLRNHGKIANKSASEDDKTGRLELPLSPAIPVYYIDKTKKTTEADRNNPNLENVYFPLMCSQVYMNGSFARRPLMRMQTAQVGWVQRRVLGRLPAGKRRLIGIIEGPPPFPAINLSLPAKADLRSATSSTSSVASNNTVTKDGKVTHSTSTTQIFKWNSKILVGGAFGAVTDGEKTLLDSALTEHKNASTLTYSYKQNLTAQGDSANTYQARPEATLITTGLNWSGYAYGVVNEQKELVKGIAEFVEFVPLPDGYQATTVYLNPNGVRPGDLTSYMKPEAMATKDWDDKMTMLDTNSMINAAGKHYIEVAWSPAGTVEEQSAASSSDTVEKTTGGNTKEVVGVTFKQKADVSFLGLVTIPVFESEGTFLGGQDVGVKDATSVGAGTTQGLTASTNIRGNALYGGCVRFSYRVYQLKPDNQYLKDLLNKTNTSAGLVTGNWPTNSTYQSENQKALDSIDPTSTPWKITYLVTSQSTYPVVLDPFAATLPPPSGVTPLPASLKSKLDAAGLTTPGIIAVASDTIAPTNVITTSAFQPSAVVITTKAVAALDAVKLSKPSFDRTQATAVLAALSAVEKQQVSDYLAAVRAAAAKK